MSFGMNIPELVNIQDRATFHFTKVRWLVFLKTLLRRHVKNFSYQVTSPSYLNFMLKTALSNLYSQALTLCICNKLGVA